MNEEDRKEQATILASHLRRKYLMLQDVAQMVKQQTDQENAQLLDQLKQQGETQTAELLAQLMELKEITKLQEEGGEPCDN